MMNAPVVVPDEATQLAAGHRLGGLVQTSVRAKRSNWAYTGAVPAAALRVLSLVPLGSLVLITS